MTVHTILRTPDPRLHEVAQAVDLNDPRLAELASDLLHTLRASGGIGLAAPQLGWPLRMVAIDLSAGRKKANAFVWINPTLQALGSSVQGLEACLSVPHRKILVARSSKVQVEAWTPSGQRVSQTAQGLLAVCLQHEVDHLNGRLIADPPSAAPSLP